MKEDPRLGDVKNLSYSIHSNGILLSWDTPLFADLVGIVIWDISTVREGLQSNIIATLNVEDEEYSESYFVPSINIGDNFLMVQSMNKDGYLSPGIHIGFTVGENDRLTNLSGQTFHASGTPGGVPRTHRKVEVVEGGYMIEPVDIVDEAFVTTWKTNNTGTSSSTQITLPLKAFVTYNFSVDWGDGSSQSYASYTPLTHTYSVAGTYTVRITPTGAVNPNGSRDGFHALYFANGGDRLKLLTIEKWGSSRWTSWELSFWGCSNMKVNPLADYPYTAGMTNSCRVAFRDCGIEVMDLSGCDLSGVPSFNTMWYQCTSLTTLDLAGVDVSSVTNIALSVSGCSSLVNLYTSGWDTGSLVNCDQCLWDSPNVSAASLATLKDWNVAGLTAGNQRIANVSQMSTQDYDALLTAWGAQSVKTGVVLTLTPTKYSPAGVAGRNSLISQGWTINDGGPE